MQAQTKHMELKGVGFQDRGNGEFFDMELSEKQRFCFRNARPGPHDSTKSPPWSVVGNFFHMELSEKAAFLFLSLSTIIMMLRGRAMLCMGVAILSVSP